MTGNWPVERGVLELGDFEVECGGVLPGARLSWETHGTLNPARDNLIVYPCGYAAQHSDLSWLIGPDGILDPTRYFIVVPDMFCNGLSTSPADSTDFPASVTIGDNVRAQHKLLTRHFEVHQVAAAYGFSVGAMQAYHWAAQFPDMVERAIIVCGSAKTAVHNRIVLSGLLRTLEAAPEYLGSGQFFSEPVAAVRAFAHIFAGWGLSQDLYRDGLHLTALGFPDLNSFLTSYWEQYFGDKMAANLYAQAVTWSNADISAGPMFRGNLEHALRAISARVLLMPSVTDLYFRVADSASELAFLRRAKLQPIPSMWGHQAGNPTRIPRDFAFLRNATNEWLNAS